MYELKKDKNKITFLDVSDFNVDHVFDCGQCFRWKKENENTYYGVVDGNFARVSFFEKEKKDDDLEVRGDLQIESYQTDESFWAKYFDLDRDYGKIKKQLAKDDPTMAKAIEEGWGIRILKQDVWETLISFIISQNSNIPRIKNCIETICKEYGREIGEYRGEKIYSFPTLQDMAKCKEADLKLCRLGYRAKYIAEGSRQINRDGGSILDIAESMSDNDVLKYLLNISGVGPKVASCIMLFSMSKLNIFPIDVWVKRVMNRLYSIDEDNITAMKDYAEKHFGKYGGIAQQYLFYYIRQISVNDPELYKSLEIDNSTASKK